MKLVLSPLTGQKVTTWPETTRQRWHTFKEVNKSTDKTAEQSDPLITDYIQQKENTSNKTRKQIHSLKIPHSTSTYHTWLRGFTAESWTQVWPCYQVLQLKYLPSMQRVNVMSEVRWHQQVFRWIQSVTCRSSRWKQLQSSYFEGTQQWGSCTDLRSGDHEVWPEGVKRYLGVFLKVWHWRQEAVRRHKEENWLPDRLLCSFDYTSCYGHTESAFSVRKTCYY